MSYLHKNIQIKISLRDYSFLGFGPYLVIESLPWLLLASSLRALGHAAGSNLIWIILQFLVPCLIFLAAIPIVDVILQKNAGQSILGKLGIDEKINLTKNTMLQVGKAYIICLFAVGSFLIYLQPGQEKTLHIFGGVFFSLVGQVYPDAGIHCRIASGFFFLLMFMFIIGSSAGYKNNLWSILKLIRKHLVFLLPAILIVITMMHYISIYQVTFLRYAVGDWFDAHGISFGWGYVITQTIMGTFRLWLSVLILTKALKFSYQVRMPGHTRNF
jgi:hypothetical protein